MPDRDIDLSGIDWSQPLAIPNLDGSVTRIHLLRQPAPSTTFSAAGVELGFLGETGGVSRGDAFSKDVLSYAEASNIIVSGGTPAQQLLTYLTALPNQATHRCVIGQYFANGGGSGEINGDGTGVDPMITVNLIGSQTGKLPGLVGVSTTYSTTTAATRQCIQQVWSEGSIPFLTWDPFNPLTGGNVTDLTAGSLHAAVTVGSAAYNTYQGFLAQAASDLNSIKSLVPGIAILFRTLAELNGNWNWWQTGIGGNTTADYITLWRMTHDYFTITAGLKDTLVFDYNTNAGFAGSSYTNAYPGSAYVDVTSFDYYGNNPATDPVTAYNSLLTLAKPIHWGEFGTGNASGPITANSFDNVVMLNCIKNTFPKVFGVMYWHGWWAIPTQLNANTLMNDAVIATATDVHAPTRFSSNQPPNPVIRAPTDGFTAQVGTSVTLDPTGTSDPNSAWGGTWTVTGQGGAVRFTYTGNIGDPLASFIRTWSPTVAENVTVIWSVTDGITTVLTSVGGTITPAIVNVGGLYPNLPSGYTIPSNFICTFANGSLNGALASEGSWTPFPASGGFSQQLRDGSAYTPSSVTAPRHPPASPNLIGEVIDYAGMVRTGIAAGGMNGPGIGVLGANNWKGLYLVYYLQLPSNWVSHPSGVNKVGFANINGFPMFYLTAQGGTSWELHCQDLQSDPNAGGGARNLTPNLASAGVTLGLFQCVQVQLISNTPGAADGIARAWLTNFNSSGVIVSGPTHTHEYTNVGWVNSVGNPVWQFVNWSPIYGGNSSGTLAAAQYMWMDHIAVGGAVVG